MAKIETNANDTMWSLNFVQVTGVNFWVRCASGNVLASPARRYRSDFGYWLSQSVRVGIDFTDVTLVGEDTYGDDEDYDRGGTTSLFL